MYLYFLYCFLGANQFSLLDCIFSKSSNTFYCLDLIAWKGQSVADTDFECRIFLMNSRLSENANYGERSKEFPVSRSPVFWQLEFLPDCFKALKLLPE